MDSTVTFLHDNYGMVATRPMAICRMRTLTRLLRLGAPLLLNVVAVPAFAATGGDMDPATILQSVLTVMTGSMGTALAALGIIACGLAWMFGRASLGLISGVIGGIMIVFSSAYVANQLVGSGG